MSGLSPHKFFSTDSYTIKKTYKLDLCEENKLKIYTDLALKVIKAAGYKEQAVNPRGPICQHTSTSQTVWRGTEVLRLLLYFLQSRSTCSALCNLQYNILKMITYVCCYPKPVQNHITLQHCKCTSSLVWISVKVTTQHLYGFCLISYIPASLGVLARTGTYWHVLARTGTYWHALARTQFSRISFE